MHADKHSPARPSADARLRAFYRHLALWILQSWLAMFFFASGYAKLTQPRDTLTLLMDWPGRVPAEVLVGAGGLEIVAALGLLAPLAGWGFGLPLFRAGAAMILTNTLLMAAYYVRAANLGLAAVNVILMGMAAAVLIGRRRSPQMV